jgi:hypothetical protein
MLFVILSLMWSALTGHVSSYDNGTSGGVVVSVDATHCAGVELYGEPGLFGNVWGLKGGDCA